MIEGGEWRMDRSLGRELWVVGAAGLGILTAALPQTLIV